MEEIKPKNRVLDFGSGYNGISGADWLSSESADYGSDHVWRPGFERNDFGFCNIKVGDKIPAEDHWYDVIHTNGALHYDSVEEWKWIFEEFKRVLAPNGIIVLRADIHPTDPLVVEMMDDVMYGKKTVEDITSYIRNLINQSFPDTQVKFGMTPEEADDVTPEEGYYSVDLAINMGHTFYARQPSYQWQIIGVIRNQCGG